MAASKEYFRQYYLRNREKKIAQSKAYREANKEAVKEQRRSYWFANKERLQAAWQEWYKTHREHSIQYCYEWRKLNPEKQRANARRYVLNRRARLANAAGIFDYDLWLQKVLYHGWKCLYCYQPLTENTVTVDHRKPLSKGGSNWIANLAPACKSCNSGKQDKDNYGRRNEGQ